MSIISLKLSIDCKVNFFYRNEFYCTLTCNKDKDCKAIHFDATTKSCQIGELKNRVDLATGVGIRVKVDKEHLPPKG